MRVKVSGIQNAVHRGGVQRGNVAPLDLVMQRLHRPADPGAASLLRRGAGQSDDLHPLQGGKAAAGGHCGDGRIVQPTGPGRSVCAICAPRCGGGGVPGRWRRSASLPRPTRWRERAWPSDAPSCPSGRAAPGRPVHREIRRSGLWAAGRGEAPVEDTNVAALLGSTSASTKGASMSSPTTIRPCHQKSCSPRRTWETVH